MSVELLSQQNYHDLEFENLYSDSLHLSVLRHFQVLVPVDAWFFELANTLSNGAACIAVAARRKVLIIVITDIRLAFPIISGFICTYV